MKCLTDFFFSDKLSWCLQQKQLLWNQYKQFLMYHNENEYEFYM